MSGRGGAAVLLAYRLLLALTALYVVVTLPLEAVDLFRNAPATARYGFSVQRTARGVLPVTKLLPFAAGGPLREGDVIFGVGGVRLGPRATRFDLGAKLDALGAGPATLDLVDPATGIERRIALRPHPRPLLLIHPYYGMPLWLFGIVHLLALGAPLLLLLGASVLLSARRPHDPVAMLLAVAFLALTFSTSSGSWPFLYLHVPDAIPAYAISLGAGLLCVAIAAVPDGRLSAVWGRLTLLFAALYGFGDSWFRSIGVAHPVVGIVASGFEYAAFFCAAVALLLRYRASAAVQRQQLKWVLIGMLVAALVFPATLAASYGQVDAALPAWGQYLLGMLPYDLFHVAVPIGLLVAVLAYRLYDSEAAVTRTTAYAAASVAAVGVFAASESVVQSFGQKLVAGELGAFPGTLAAAFTAMMIGPLHARIKRMVERGFREDLFHMREALPPLVGDLRETTALTRIAAIVVARVADGVRPTAAAIVMGDATVAMQDIDAAAIAAWRAGWTPRADVALDCDKGDPVFPTRVRLSADGVGAVGWLLLGPRPDGTLFGKDERKALTEIADPVARALAIAASRDARAALHAETTRALQARIDQVEAALTRLATRPAPAS